jgi:hypothetical protein
VSGFLPPAVDFQRAREDIISIDVKRALSSPEQPDLFATTP